MCKHSKIRSLNVLDLYPTDGPGTSASWDVRSMSNCFCMKWTESQQVKHFHCETVQLITNDFLPARRFTKLTPIRLLQLLALQCKRTITDVNRQSFTITLVITEIIIRASSAGSKSSPRAPRRCGRNGKHPKVPQLKAEGCWRSFELSS